MLSDHHRRQLDDLERQFQREDPVWVRQFKDFRPRARQCATSVLNAALAILAILAGFSLLFGLPEAVVSLVGLALILVFVRFYL